MTIVASKIPKNPTAMSRRHVILGTVVNSFCATSFLTANTSAHSQSPPNNTLTMTWTDEQKKKYSDYMKVFVRTYNKPIDCANLAIEGLLRFSKANNLPARLFDYQGINNTKRWFILRPDDDFEKFVSVVTEELGAVNVIENTIPISIENSLPGDLIMSEARLGATTYTGHTRIIDEIKLVPKSMLDWFGLGHGGDHDVTWYQGNLPPVIPEKKNDYFKNIGNVTGGSPRRWNFNQFV